MNRCLINLEEELRGILGRQTAVFHSTELLFHRLVKSEARSGVATETVGLPDQGQRKLLIRESKYVYE